MDAMTTDGARAPTDRRSEAGSRAREGIACLQSLRKGASRARTFGLAAAMAFWLFLSLVPLAAVAGLLAARLVAARPWVLQSALASVPPQVRELVMSQVQQVAHWHGGAVAPAAVATFVWLASSGVSAIFDALEAQTGTSRPWWRRRLFAIASCVGLSIGTAVVALLSVGLDRLRAFAEHVLGGPTIPAAGAPLVHAVERPLTFALRWGAGAVIWVGMIALLYRVGIPGKKSEHDPVLPGAILAAVLHSVLGGGYGWYVATLGSRSGAYEAGLAVIGVTLVTLWLFSVALLLGAELNRVLAERLRRRGAWQRSDASSSPQISRKPRTEPSTGPSSSPPVSTPP
jgi:membrane protein